ncbi:nephrin-like [Schistocerca gregaria]|uniref:nephrin-like n=1 Tax=Schistocerca gregaria TaxID=7010 RepID=UPI00211E1341|nr:nephrin-like [Schistocerca gregaria]
MALSAATWSAMRSSKIMIGASVLLAALALNQASVIAQGPVVPLTAVEGREALLPCNVTPSIAGDDVFLVLWSKDADHIYSYDARDRPMQAGAHWRDMALVGDRVFFRTATSPPELAIGEVRESDKGLYRCRVDFRESPSRTTRIRLEVVVPPQAMRIIDTHGNELQRLTMPYVEGDTMRLTCMVSGGRPPPTLRWWREDSVLESRALETAFPTVREQMLILPRLSRADLHASFTCQAVNSDLIPPMTATVLLEMNLRVTNVRLEPPEEPLSAGRVHSIECRAEGSRPSALITWWLGDRPLPDTLSFQQVSLDGSETTSTLTWTPSQADHDQLLRCLASNPRLNVPAMEDTLVLNVHYAPLARVHVDSEVVHEGADILLHCEVTANPAAYKITWRKDDLELEDSEDVTVMGEALALRSVTRAAAGGYSCVASNVEGDGQSLEVDLRVMFAPVCRPGQRSLYAVARHEEARVLCEVDAFPPPAQDGFRWAFNGSAETVDVPATRFTSSGRSSQLTYAPVTETDYGSAFCWATNAAGRQKQPCVFHIVPAGAPDPPANCSVLNQTSHSVDVRCTEGFDGGRPQVFLLEAAEAASRLPLLNVTSRAPAFHVGGLQPGVQLVLRVSASSAKGRSRAVSLRAATLDGPERIAGELRQLELWQLVTVLAGAVALLVGTAATIVVRRHRRHQQSQRRDSASHKQGSVFVRDPEDPDVVPQRTPATSKGSPTVPTWSDSQSSQEDGLSEHEAEGALCCDKLMQTIDECALPEPRFPPHRWVPRETVTYAQLQLTPTPTVRRLHTIPEVVQYAHIQRRSGAEPAAAAVASAANTAECAV